MIFPAYTITDSANSALDAWGIAVKNPTTSVTQFVDQWYDTTSYQTIGQYQTTLTRSKAPPPPDRQYATPPREFNRYVNASDLLQEFIAYAGAQGVRRAEVLGLPVELFLKWLIIQACEAEQEEPNVTLELPVRAPQPRCLGCQRFMSREVAVALHDERCARLYFARPPKEPHEETAARCRPHRPRARRRARARRARRR